MDLQLIDDFIKESNSSNSNNDKLKVLEKYTQYEIVRKVLNYTYNTFKQYHVTSKNCQKNKELSESGYTDLFTLLDDLDSRKITGYQAIKYVNGFIEINEPYEDIIYNILDRNLKTRSTASMINKAYPGLIPTFDVALANPYNDKTAKKVDWQDGWYISRKLDGCLYKDSLIEFENGDVLTIKEVVDNQMDGNIKSYNTNNGKIEYKPITNWMVNLDDISDDNTQWFEIELEDGKLITLTGNHRIWIPELRCWRRADDLNGSETILVD